MSLNGKFKIEQKDLISLLSSMQPICNKRTALDVTEYILFQIAPKELILKSTDLEVSLQSNIAISSDLLDNVDFLISGKRIFELVKELEGEIEFTIQENQLNLKASGVELSLNIRDKEDFPPFPERIENLMQVESNFFLDMISKVAFLIPQSNSNAALNGMLLEFNDQGMCMVATDGHRLSRIKTDKYKLAEEKKWLLPKRAVLELKKILEASLVESIFLGVCGNQLVFSGINFNFFTKLISDSFPHYLPVLQKDDFLPAVVEKEAFLKTLKRTNCLLGGQFLATDFSFQKDFIHVSLHNKEVGKLDESVNLKDFSGDAFKSQFYSPYMLSGLQVFPQEKLQFYVKNNTKPIIFEAQEENYHLTYLVMPVSSSQTQQRQDEQV
ncbi:DNA polymerase III subunit beta [Candidatus Babeliales bacterium]|nr:DNA polymerase III subunit beta [Candidatus Babeliales bacterium]MCF7899114.1 DNA polymerase III subunit beta [Candidatus Babeliales bacterium]